MRMKAGGPPPKVEVEPRKERIKTKAPLPSFKPVSRVPSASGGGPGMGTVKKEVGAGAGAKAVAGALTKGRVVSGGVKGLVVKKEVGVVEEKKEESSKVEVVGSISQPPVALLEPTPPTSITEEPAARLLELVEQEAKHATHPFEPATIPLPSSPTHHPVNAEPTPCLSTSTSIPFPASTTISNPPSPTQIVPTSLDLARLVLNKEERDFVRPKTTSLVSSNGGSAPTVFDDAGDSDLTDDGSGSGMGNESDEEKGVKYNPLASKLRAKGTLSYSREFGGEDGAAKAGTSEVGKLGKLVVELVGGGMDSPRVREFGVEKGNL